MLYSLATAKFNSNRKSTGNCVSSLFASEQHVFDYHRRHAYDSVTASESHEIHVKLVWSPHTPHMWANGGVSKSSHIMENTPSQDIWRSIPGQSRICLERTKGGFKGFFLLLPLPRGLNLALQLAVSANHHVKRAQTALGFGSLRQTRAKPPFLNKAPSSPSLLSLCMAVLFLFAGSSPVFFLTHVPRMYANLGTTLYRLPIPAYFTRDLQIRRHQT